MGNKRRGKHQGKVPVYLEDVVRVAQEGELLPGGVTHVEVRHEPTCDQLNGRGPCNCQPDVRLVRPS